ncbi:MAG TPA: hypothetical protein VF059_13175 [Casimicrobiaceae bacterium]
MPLAANVSIYHSEVFVRNPNASPITLNVRYYQSNDATPPAGLRSCSQVALQANQSASFDLGTQCGLTGTDDDFGMLILEDAAQTNPFFAYSRTQTPDGIGFSVEGFPTSNFSGEPADALGLQALASAPNYRSNCFVASLAQAVNWHLDLYQGGTESLLGSTSGALGPYQTTRILDVFASLGLPGDFSDVRATFSTSDDPAPSFIGFCTLETSANGSADFRVAKSLASPPAPPAEITTIPWSGPMGTLFSNTVSPIFVGPTATVNLAAPGNVSAYGSGSFARQSGSSLVITVGVCYQDQNGPGPVTVMGSATNTTVTTSEVASGAAGSASLPAGTYNVGLCATNNNAGAVNKNGNTSGFVFVTP